jgi:hypothetical protein
MSDAVMEQDDVMALIDQAAFLPLQATDRRMLAQIVWYYERTVDIDELRRFHANLGFGLLGRRIERSPLPFGRHRWVSCPGPQAELDIAEPRPRAAFSDWLDERAELPVHPEHGPGWHLGVLPMTDGSTAVSLVASHCLADGLGLFATIVDAIKGNARDFGHPPPHSRNRWRAMAADAGRTVRDLPDLGRTLVTGAKLAARNRRELVRARPSRHIRPAQWHGNRRIVVPAISIVVDVADWDARAEALGGTPYSLLAGLAARLGDRVGRGRAEDSSVSLIIAMSDRTPEDTRANALRFAPTRVNAAEVTTDLTGTRLAIRRALTALREEPDARVEMLPITPFVPLWAVARAADMVLGDHPVSCSHLGEIDSTAGRPDGDDADYVVARGVDQNVSQRQIEQVGGLLVVAALRCGAKTTISIVAYQPGEANTKALLRDLAARTLAEFGLTGEIV